MIVIMICCGLVCGCLTEDNKEIECPLSYTNVVRVYIDPCNGPNEPLACYYCK